jgi:Holliday junction resolvasome RuvABC endonuclease subunit
MKILTLDLGTKTGWAYARNEGLDSGVINFKTARHEGGGMRFHRFRGWLERFERPDFLYFEEVRRHNSVGAAHVYGGFMATLTAYCEASRIPFCSVPVGTIKKHISGSGNASKNKVITAVYDRYGIFADDDNHADALAILAYAQDVLHGGGFVA